MTDAQRLRARLEKLATDWETIDLGPSESIAGASYGEATYREAASQLRQVIEEFS